MPKHAFGSLYTLGVDVAYGVVRRHSEADFIAGFIDGNMKVWYLPEALVQNHVLKGPVMAGCSCILIKRKVIERLKFRCQENLGEDVYFAYDVAREGFTAAIDGDVQCGHLPEKPLVKNTLDIGCGHKPQGSVNLDLHPEPTLHRSDGQIVLSDIPIDLEKAVNFIKGDCLHLPFSNESFENLYSNQLIEHLENPQDFLAECIRVAKHTLIIACPDPDGPCAEMPLHIQKRLLTPEWFKRILDRNQSLYHQETIDKPRDYLWVKIFKQGKRVFIYA